MHGHEHSGPGFPGTTQSVTSVPQAQTHLLQGSMLSAWPCRWDWSDSNPLVTAPYNTRAQKNATLIDVWQQDEVRLPAAWLHWRTLTSCCLYCPPVGKASNHVDHPWLQTTAALTSGICPAAWHPCKFQSTQIHVHQICTTSAEGLIKFRESRGCQCRDVNFFF